MQERPPTASEITPTASQKIERSLRGKETLGNLGGTLVLGGGLFVASTFVLKTTTLLLVSLIACLAIGFLITQSILGKIRRRSLDLEKKDRELAQQIEEKKKANAQAERERREEERKRVQERKAEALKQAEMRKQHQRQTQAHVLREQLSMYPVDLQSLAGQTVEAIAEAVAGDLQFKKSLEIYHRRALEEKKAENRQPHLCSFAFHEGLDRLCKLDKKILRSSLVYALEVETNRLLIPEGKDPKEPSLLTDLRVLFRFETWFSPLVPENMAAWRLKPMPAAGLPVRYVAYARNKRSDGRPEEVLTAWRMERERWVRERSGHLLFGEEGEFFAVNRDVAGESALVDLFHKGACQYFPIDSLHENDAAQEALGIIIRRQMNPFTPAQITTKQFKGSVTFSGYWVDGKWTAVEGKARERTMLSASAPNFISRMVYSRVSDTDREENRLLNELTKNPPEELRRAISTQGRNFLIRRGAMPNSDLYQFYLKPGENVVTEWYQKPLGNDPDGFTKPELYSPVVAPVEPRTPLEGEGYMAMNFSECYLRTGDASVQLCLHFDLGSPAAGQYDSEGTVNFDEPMMRKALYSFARRQDVEPEKVQIWEYKAAQGLIATATMRNPQTGWEGTHFFKLLDPLHSGLYDSHEVFQRLQQANVLPQEISAHRCNLSGEDSEEGKFLTFLTPQYRSVAEVIQERGAALTDSEATSLCQAIGFFAKQILEKELVCSDITLADTMLMVNSLEELPVQWKQGRPGVLVVDYGSYVLSEKFNRKTCIVKGEYRAPEDEDESLPFAAEPYQVYQLGLLFLQIHLGDSASLRLEAGEIEAFLETLKGRFEAEEVELLKQCLHPDPNQRLRITVRQ